LPPAPISTTTRTLSSRACAKVSTSAATGRHQRVAHLRPVERELQDRPVALNDQRFMPA
jgi:hypothetical protein